MSRPTLTVVSNADERFFPGLALAVVSAVAAASGNYDYEFLILDGGLPPGRLAELKDVLAELAIQKRIKVSLDLLTVDQRRLESLPERRGSRMTYAKLLLPEILSQHESIIYLDADVLCFAGVEEVRPPFESQCLLAGARDYFGVIEKDCPWLEQVPVAERQLPYLNCGVMWMNLAGLRAMDFTGHAIRARAAAGDARQGDQAVFNFLCRGRSWILPEAINHRTSIGASRPLCDGSLDLNLHYIGSPKPWLGPPKTSNWLAHQLWHQAQRACFPGWVLGGGVGGPPWDCSRIRRKAWLYKWLNPSRAAHYAVDLGSVSDPGKVLELARQRWDGVLGGVNLR